MESTAAMTEYLPRIDADTPWKNILWDSRGQAGQHCNFMTPPVPACVMIIFCDWGKYI